MTERGTDFTAGDGCYSIYVCSNSDIPLQDSATVAAAVMRDGDESTVMTALMSLFTPCGGEFQEEPPCSPGRCSR